MRKPTKVDFASERLNVRISGKLKRAINRQARAEEMTESEYVRLCLLLQTGLAVRKGSEAKK